MEEHGSRHRLLLTPARRVLAAEQEDCARGQGGGWRQADRTELIASGTGRVEHRWRGACAMAEIQKQCAQKGGRRKREGNGGTETGTERDFRRGERRDRSSGERRGRADRAMDEDAA